MPRVSSETSVAALKRMLSDRKAELSSLTKRRLKLQRELADVERRINAIAGMRGRGRRGARPKNAKSLTQTVNDLLTKNKKGFTLDELSKKVLSTGYKTSSSNFKNVLYQCLYNSDVIGHDSRTGTYRLKPAKRKASPK